MTLPPAAESWGKSGISIKNISLGRPNFPKIFEDVYNYAFDNHVTRVAVGFCGPKGMNNEINDIIWD